MTLDDWLKEAKTRCGRPTRHLVKDCEKALRIIEVLKQSAKWGVEDFHAEVCLDTTGCLCDESAQSRNLTLAEEIANEG